MTSLRHLTLAVSTHLKKAFFISTILLILGCANNPTEIRYYPSQTNPLNNKAVLMGLDTTDLNFRQITNKVANYYRKPEYLVIEFNDGRIKKRITPYVYTGGLIRYRNVFPITSDSILKDGGYSILELKRLLKKHYTNNDKDFKYAQSAKRAIVEVTIDTSKSGKELKEVLTKLTRTFDQIQEETIDTLELKVFFDFFRQIPPPPPPPPKMEAENE